ncbi:MAG: FGGY family carbohydrate kinase [Terriglobia bacterium]
MPLIALDIGTSFIKGAVVDPHRFQLTHIHRVPFPDPLPNLPARHFEVDPYQIVTAVRGVISHLIQFAPTCEGIVMCGQMGGLILVNERGEPLSNYISWKDQRATENHPSGAGTYFEIMEGRLSPAERRQLGNEVRPGLPLSFLSWFAEQNRSFPSQPMAAALADFVVANLCETIPQTEPTNAVGALNLETQDWHHDAFSSLGLPQVRWPVLRDYREPVGHLRINSITLLKVWFLNPEIINAHLPER